MKELYLKTVARLKTVQLIRWIDADYGQMEYYAERPAVSFPAALVSIDIIACENITDTTQICTARVTVRLCFAPAGQTSSAAPAKVQQTALAMFDTVTSVFKALQGWEDDQVSPFIRLNQATEKRDDPYRVIIQNWETTFEQDA